MSSRASQPDWRMMRRLEQKLMREFAAEGVVRVEFVIAFSEPLSSRWLGTHTDAERDTLTTDTFVDGRIRMHIAALNAATLYRSFAVESQETVDIEYEGSWFYRLR